MLSKQSNSGKETWRLKPLVMEPLRKKWTSKICSRIVPRTLTWKRSKTGQHTSNFSEETWSTWWLSREHIMFTHFSLSSPTSCSRYWLSSRRKELRPLLQRKSLLLSLSSTASTRNAKSLTRVKLLFRKKMDRSSNGSTCASMESSSLTLSVKFAHSLEL